MSGGTGVPVCIVQDWHGLILHHAAMWTEEDVDMAVPVVKAVQRRWPEFRGCSFDRGFHSTENRAALDELLEVNALPRKGNLGTADRKREAAPKFRTARRLLSAVESGVNHLERHGLDRVLSLGADGFARTVALSVLAANLHRLGRIAIDEASRKRKQLRRLAA